MNNSAKGFLAPQNYIKRIVWAAEKIKVGGDEVGATPVKMGGLDYGENCELFKPVSSTEKNIEWQNLQQRKPWMPIWF